MDLYFLANELLSNPMDRYNFSMFYHWFWTDSFWVPVGYTWKDFEGSETVRKAELTELYILPALILAMFVVRYVFENFIAKQFCLYVGIKDKQKFRANKSCERLYSSGVKIPNTHEVNGLVNETKMTKQQIYIWFRHRKNRNKMSLMRKATECSWRFVAYLVLFLYGSFVLLKTDWFWDNSKWLQGYIKEHQFTDDMKWYYLLEMSFYLSLSISQFFDNKRKDAAQQFIHHFATLFLLFGSYTLSLYRFGAVIMYLHDAADFWLEGAKVANYAKMQSLCDTLFAMFAIIFFLTRLVYYPVYVAYGYFHYNNNTNSLFHNTLVCLCFVLLFLHFYWGFLIGRMIYRLVVVGKVEKDTRSDTESDNEE